MDSCALYYNDVIMSTMASQITSFKIVYSTVYSGAAKIKHQSSASLAFVRGLHRWPVNSPHKGPVTRKMFPFDDVIMMWQTWPKVSRHIDDILASWYHISFTASCLFKSLFGLATKKTWNLRINSSLRREIPWWITRTQRASKVESVSMLWRHYEFFWDLLSAFGKNKINEILNIKARQNTSYQNPDVCTSKVIAPDFE